MNLTRLFFLTFLAAATWLSRAQAQVASEVDASYSFVGGAKTEFGGKSGEGDVSSQSAALRAVLLPKWGDAALLRLGAEVQNYSFGLPQGAPAPNRLQSVNFVLGVDLQWQDAWLLRAEAMPGFYGSYDNLAMDTARVPVIVGGAYIESPELQWLFGALIDSDNFWPVIPTAGARWGFTERWVLNAVLPSPRVEYNYSKALKLYSGLDVKAGTFRVDGAFGDAHGNPALNNAVLNYTEVRAGAGVSWKATASVNVSLEAGFMPYRIFDFHRASVDYETTGGAPYGQVAISTRF